MRKTATVAGRIPERLAHDRRRSRHRACGLRDDSPLDPYGHAARPELRAHRDRRREPWGHRRDRAAHRGLRVEPVAPFFGFDRLRRPPRSLVPLRRDHLEDDGHLRAEGARTRGRDVPAARVWHDARVEVDPPRRAHEDRCRRRGDDEGRDPERGRYHRTPQAAGAFASRRRKRACQEPSRRRPRAPVDPPSAATTSTPSTTATASSSRTSLARRSSASRSLTGSTPSRSPRAASGGRREGPFVSKDRWRALTRRWA